jgi:predicted CxxxxCH...CXXCH cytochrome family protein
MTGGKLVRGIAAGALALSGTLVACPGPVAPGSGKTPTDPDLPGATAGADGSGWCAVRAIFSADCVACHDAAQHQGNLDLETDPYGATVGVVSPDFGVVLVQPGDPDGSLLYRKLAGTELPSEGDPMPLGAALSATRLDAVRQWIADGATRSCDDPPTDTITGSGGRFHPTDWADADAHGLATDTHAGIDPSGADCRDCHGADLTGGAVGVSCDACHRAGWRTDCTYCHGGVLDHTGAPPEDMDGTADPAAISFPDHPAHVRGPDHPAYDCVQCHDKPTDALSAGHLWDDATPGVPELTFTGGISSQAAFAAGTCSNLWCHGDGTGDNGEVTAASGPLTCDSCHTTGSALGGHHEKHLSEGFACAECHPDVSESQTITVGALHVQGTVDVVLPDGIAFDGDSCDGECHGEGHGDRTW